METTTEQMERTALAGHTPGPWFAANGNEVHNFRATFDEHGARTGNTPDVICRIEFPYCAHQHGSKEANAALIAAAPELLAALQAIMLKAVRQQAAGGDIMDFQDRLRESADIARAAIAQALGTDG